MKINWHNTQGIMQVAGKSLEWASFGAAPGDAPVIILLHEGLGSLALWRDFPKRLCHATGLSVFAYSRAGYGQSQAADLPRPLDYMTQEAVDVLPQVLNAIGAPGYILLGHSDGATIAAEFAGRIEDFRLRGLILMAPHFFTEPMGLQQIAAAKAQFETGDLAQRLGKYHHDAKSTFLGWNDVWLHPDFKDWNVAEVIDYFRIPSLVIQGENDQYGTLAQVQEIETRSYAPVETLILENCQHAPHIDQFEKTVSAITEFTARLQRIENQKVETA